MAQHGSTGKHGAENSSLDSARTQKMDRAGRPDETKEMPRATKAASGSTVMPVNVGGSSKSEAKQVTSGAEDAAAAAKKKRTAIIAAVVAIFVIVAAIVIFMMMSSNKGSDVVNNDLEVVDVESTPIDNPIDFAAWQEKNPDVYAYMTIPNTNIDLPILFNAENDNYYLIHDIDGNTTIVGAIYTQSMNTQDFTDPVTVLYGHTLLNDTMFSQLHKFENPEFFAENPYFMVYLPDEALTYEVVSAFEYDDRHIMNTFDFTNEETVQEFFDTVTNPDTLKKQVREDIELDAANDKIIVLSTCTQPADDNKRFLLVGALRTVQPTK